MSVRQDKYSPIPGEMDTIDCLRKERDELISQLKTAAEIQEHILSKLEAYKSPLANDLFIFFLCVAGIFISGFIFGTTCGR